MASVTIAEAPIAERSPAPMMAAGPQLLGEMLIAEGAAAPEDVQRALAFQQSYGGRLGQILVRLGALVEDRVLAALSRQTGLPVMDGPDLPSSPQAFLDAIALSGCSPDWWVDQGALPFDHPKGGMTVIARDPLDPMLQEILAGAFDGASPAFAYTPSSGLDRLLDIVAQAGGRSRSDEIDEVSHLRELAEEAPVVELVANLMTQAFQAGASDIHIEPGERQFRVRLRIDGVLQTHLNLPRDRFDAVASRIKLISGLDIAERRLPQDGRLSSRMGGEEIDVRVSALPGVWGESIVMRLLPKERKEYRLDRLGMNGPDLERWQTVTKEPHGIVLITGPTGSGKSTTLYATLEEINDGLAKIITVEEPVEYNIPGISQVQAHSEIGYTFARALRSILRQDPDRIMIGEIRDLETAQIAVQAALTGHMVYSTLHTNDAISAFTRLLDMGIEPFLCASTVRGVMAQRLVRRLCGCAVPDPAAAEGEALLADARRLRPNLFAGTATWRKAQGCPNCNQTGYRGRLGIYELVTVTPALSDAVMHRQSAHDLLAVARAGGDISLREDGLLKARAGLTSAEEVMRVTGIGA